MSDPSLDALARLAAAAQAMLDGACTCPTYAAWSPGCARSDCPCHGEHVPRAPDLARGLVAAVDALRAERERATSALSAYEDEVAAHDSTKERLDAEERAVDAAEARATDATARLAAVRAAVRGEREARAALHRGLREHRGAAPPELWTAHDEARDVLNAIDTEDAKEGP